MTAGPSLDPARFLHEHLATASPDLLRELLGVFIDTLMGAEADGTAAGFVDTRGEWFSGR
nr:hypothetical protein [Cellulomonas marina]